MTKLSKTKILARRKTQSAKNKVKNSERRLTQDRVDAQIAELEEQIALLKEEGEVGRSHCAAAEETRDRREVPNDVHLETRDRREVPNDVHVGKGQNPIASLTQHDGGQGLAALPGTRAKLPTPVLGRVFAVDSVTISATWNEIEGAGS